MVAESRSSRNASSAPSTSTVCQLLGIGPTRKARSPRRNTWPSKLEPPQPTAAMRTASRHDRRPNQAIVADVSMPLRPFRATFPRVLPIGDRNPTRATPFVNYSLLALNVVAFYLQYRLTSAEGGAAVVPGYGLVPIRLTSDVAGEAFTIF